MKSDSGVGVRACPASAPEQSASYSFAIRITNGSGTTVSVQTATLTSGQWQGTPPAPGAPILSGQTQQYVNAAMQIFTGLGGTITLVPMTGGTVYVTWSWPQGTAPTGWALAQNTKGIAVTSQLTGVGSSNPVLQVSINNIA